MSQNPVTRPPLVDALSPDEWPKEVAVLIIGGGPVGLSSAILLAQRGVDVLLVERRSFKSRFPRAHLLNVRTMEIFDEMGVADDIYRMAPNDQWRKVVWYTSVDGPTSLHGLKIGEVPAWGGGPDAVRYAEASPLAFTNLPQLRLDPLLWAHADASCPGRIRPFQEVTDLDHDDETAVATVLDRETGEIRRIRARYVVAADGGRNVSTLLGVEREGPKAIREITSCYVTTDLSMWREPSALLAHIIQPQGGGRPVATLQALGPDNYNRDSSEWLVAWSRPATGRTDDEESLLTRARSLLGVPADHPMKLHEVSHWTYEGVVAEHFRVGPVFLAGDAAHRHPPTGGLGLNGGVQDAHNLAWKLAAVVQGRAPDSLLDTYELERRVIAAHNTAHSLENAGRHAPIGAALGLTPGMTQQDGWAQIGVFVSDGPAGDARRAAVAAAVADNAMDYSQLNVEAGFHYEAGALVPDGTSWEDGGPIDYRPTTRPGHHLPHVWLRHLDASREVSTLDLVSRDGFTLIVSPCAADVWREAVAAVADPSALPLSVAVVPDADRAWAAVRGVEDGGAVLVRPDSKVAWRTVTLPDDPAGAIASALETIMAGSPPETDPAAPFLARIHEAARHLAPVR